MRSLIGEVVACDHFLRPGANQECYEFHVVLKVEDSTEMIRLRTFYGAQLRLADFGRTETEKAYYDLLEIVTDMFAVGSQLSVMISETFAEYRTEKHGYHPIDKVVDPRCISVAPLKRKETRKPAVHLQLVSVNGEMLE